MVSSLSIALATLIPGIEFLDREQTGAGIILQLAVSALFFGIPILATLVLLLGIARWEGAQLRDYLGRKDGGLLRFVGFAFLVAAPLAALSLLFGYWGIDSDREAMSTGDAGLLVILSVLVMQGVLMQGIPEELWFRGMGWVSARRKPVSTLLWTTLVFTALHLLSSGGQESLVERFVYLIMPFGIGFLAGCARWCSGSVWAAAGVHGGFHIGWIPAVVGEIPLGPASWVAAGLVLIVIGLVLLWVRKPWFQPQQ